jgi:uncharacterized protein YqeY
MMDTTIRSRLEADLKTAMRGGDHDRRDAIRFILSAIKNAEIEARVGAPLDETATLRKLSKQLSDAATQYREAGRDQLAEKEEAQLAVLKEYLPAELPDEELAALAAEAVRESGASSPKEMGKVMPILMAKVDGRADGRRVSAAARAALEALA